MKFGPIPRESYLPPGAPWCLAEFPEAQITLYRWDDGGKFYALAFFGKALKPAFYHSFRTFEHRARFVRESIEGRTASLAAKAARQVARKQFVHTLAVGDMLYTSWGYDQTNVEFFEVVAVNGKSVTVREVAQDREETGFMSGRCGPVRGKFIGPEIRKLVLEGNRIKTRDFGCWASPCSAGQTHYWSSYA